MSRSTSATAATSPSRASKLFDRPRIVIPAITLDPVDAAAQLVAGAVSARAPTRAAADPVGEPDRDADDHHVDDRERRDRLDIAGLIEIVDRDRERDRARREQEDRRATAPGSPARTPAASRRTGPGRISGSVTSRMVVVQRRAEDLRALLERRDRPGAARHWRRARRAGCSGRHRRAAGSSACRRARPASPARTGSAPPPPRCRASPSGMSEA